MCFLGGRNGKFKYDLALYTVEIIQCWRILYKILKQLLSFLLAGLCRSVGLTLSDIFQF
jgi:hypothetical protein